MTDNVHARAGTVVKADEVVQVTHGVDTNVLETGPQVPIALPAKGYRELVLSVVGFLVVDLRPATKKSADDAAQDMSTSSTVAPWTHQAFTSSGGGLSSFSSKLSEV